jgi:hypothetical protein
VIERFSSVSRLIAREEEKAYIEVTHGLVAIFGQGRILVSGWYWLHFWFSQRRSGHQTHLSGLAQHHQKVDKSTADLEDGGHPIRDPIRAEI